MSFNNPNGSPITKPRKPIPTPGARRPAGSQIYKSRNDLAPVVTRPRRLSNPDKPQVPGSLRAPLVPNSADPLDDIPDFDQIENMISGLADAFGDIDVDGDNTQQNTEESDIDVDFDDLDECMFGELADDDATNTSSPTIASQPDTPVRTVSLPPVSPQARQSPVPPRRTQPPPAVHVESDLDLLDSISAQFESPSPVRHSPTTPVRNSPPTPTSPSVQQRTAPAATRRQPQQHTSPLRAVPVPVRRSVPGPLTTTQSQPAPALPADLRPPAITARANSAPLMPPARVPPRNSSGSPTRHLPHSPVRTVPAQPMMPPSRARPMPARRNAPTRGASRGGPSRLGMMQRTRSTPLASPRTSSTGAVPPSPRRSTSSRVDMQQHATVDVSSLPPLQPGSRDLDGTIDMRKYIWYHGNISSAIASQRLKNAAVGSFLVRLSSRDGCVVITWKKSNGQIIHSLLSKNAQNQWKMDDNKSSWVSVVECLAQYSSRMHTPIPVPSSINLGVGDTKVEIVLPDGGIHTLQLHSKETVQNNVRHLVQTLAKKVASLQPGGIYKLCDVSTPLQSDSLLIDTEPLRVARRIGSVPRLTVISQQRASSTAGAAPNNNKASNKNDEDQVIIGAKLPDGNILRVKLRYGKTVDHATKAFHAAAERRNAISDKGLAYVLKYRDGSVPSTRAIITSLPNVKRAAKKKQMALFLLAPPSDLTLNPNLIVWLPDGARIVLDYDGKTRVSALVARLRVLSSASVGAKEPLLLLAFNGEIDDDTSGVASSAASIAILEQTASTPLDQVPLIAAERRAGRAVRVALVRQSTVASHRRTLAMASLIGHASAWLFSDNEATAFRVGMANVRITHTTIFHTGPASLEASPDAPLPQKIMVSLELQHGWKVVTGELGETATQFVARHFAKHLAPMFPAGTKPDDVVLRSPSSLEYVYGNYPLESFEVIRAPACANQKIEMVPVIAYWLNEQLPGETPLTPEAQSLAGAWTYEHEQLSIKTTAASPETRTCFSVGDVSDALRVRVVGADIPSSRLQELRSDGARALFVTLGVYYGGEPLLEGARTPGVDDDPVSCGELSTAQRDLMPQPRWNEWIDVDIAVRDVPREARLCVTLWATTNAGVSAVGAANLLLYDYRHALRQGVVELSLWPDERANPIGTCSQNDAADDVVALALALPTYALPIVHTMNLALPERAASVTPAPDVLQKLERIAAADPLVPITPDERALLWQYRDSCSTIPRALPKVLTAAPLQLKGMQARIVAEIQRLASVWAPFERPTDALELLDARFADASVRELAVSYLERWTNDDLLGFLLQLVQVLKYEPYHDSALARYLMKRALGNPIIAHHLFWFLESEMHVPDISRRFGLLLEAYLRGATRALISLQRQMTLIRELTAAAMRIKPLKDSERLDVLRADLARVSERALSQQVDCTLDPCISLGALKVEKCKYMDSKKLPLWLVFENGVKGGDDIYIIFKAGDDLRQDMLTLQMIRLMDRLWQDQRLDLRMEPYGCIATGDEIGMIQVVLDSETTANITAAAGGVTAAFRSDPLLKWFESTAADRQLAMRQLVGVFARSLAGYCVATYVLGIGDRHNDNVMVRRNGQLFHIDFGHFLGNYKKKFGFKREKAAFVLTPDFAKVLGGKDGESFAEFVRFGCQAYNIVRKHASLFITLFAMMLSTGIPELQRAEDIEYLRDAFSLDMSDNEAEQKWRALVAESLATKTTQVNNAFHILKHGK